jgi:hypothetical protein
MSELRDRIRNLKAGLSALEFDTDKVNWQSIAVLLHNKPDKFSNVRDRLTDEDGGWATEGNSANSSGTSCYLSPKGMCYWLYHGGHSRLFYDIMALNDDRMNEDGWLHISGGRVDVATAMTTAQKAWLASNTPSDNSHNADRDAETGNLVWRYKDCYRTEGEKSPRKPYKQVWPYDVRPIVDFDIDNADHWDQLERRILLAAKTEELA